MVEDRSLRRPRRPRVVVGRDRVQELRANGDGERARVLLDEAQAEVDVPEKLPLRSGQVERPAIELERPPCVVKQGRGDEEVAPEAAMELRGFAAERRDGDRVLEEAACVAVMGIRRRGQRAEAVAEVAPGEEARDELAQAGVREFLGEELEEAVELVEVAAGLRDERSRIRLRRLERAHVELQPVAEALDTREDTDRVSFPEAPVEQLDVVPYARFHSSARVDELEREVRAARPRPQAALTGDGVHRLDDAVLRQLRDRTSGRGRRHARRV